MKEETEKSEFSEDPPLGRSPRKRSGLVLVLAILAGILLVLFAVLYFTETKEPGPSSLPRFQVLLPCFSRLLNTYILGRLLIKDHPNKPILIRGKYNHNR